MEDVVKMLEEAIDRRKVGTLWAVLKLAYSQLDIGYHLCLSEQET